MDRRRFLRSALAVAGSGAVAGNVFRPIEALAGDRLGSSTYSIQPCRYELRGLTQDARGLSGMALGNPVFAPQGKLYCVKMCWEPKVLNNASR